MLAPFRHSRLIDVRIKNSENHTFYYFPVRSDRLADFIEYLRQHRIATSSQPFIPGVGSDAMQGLNCIFCASPPKFPVMDVLSWLLQEVGHGPSLQELEDALGRWGRTVSPLHQDGSGQEIGLEINADAGKDSR